MRRSVRTLSPQPTQWLLSYANFTTVLVALFAFLFVTADIDTERLGALSSTVNTVFGPPESAASVLASEPAAVVGGIRPSTAPPAEPFALPLSEGEVDETLRRIEAGLVRGLAAERASGGLSIVRSPDWVMLLLNSDELFAPGDINLRAPGEDVLYVVAELLQDEFVLVSVSAHTDDQLASAEASWQLSGRRAAAVARQLQREGLAPQRISAQGFGGFQPLRPSDSAEQRAENRRIEILISNPLGQ